MSVKKYQKKPVVIEAAQLNAHNVREVAKWCGADLGHTYGSTEPDALDIHTLEGTMVAYVDDYIIRGVQGEFYPCKPDIFAATYEVPTNDETEADEHHSVQELYDYRMAYNALLFNQWAREGKYDVHKSWRHGDGEKCFGGGWFIVSATTPYGQVTNHYSSEHWHRFHVPIRERATEWDGHTPQQALERLIRLAEVTE